MKALALAFAMLVIATVVYAACTTHTIILPDGRIQTCTTCCGPISCVTTCV